MMVMPSFRFRDSGLQRDSMLTRKALLLQGIISGFFLGRFAYSLGLLNVNRVNCSFSQT